MLPGLMPVPAIVGIGGTVSGGVTGTPIGLLLVLTKEIPTSGGGGGVTGTPIGLLLSLTKEVPGGGGGFTSGEFTDDDSETSFIDDDGETSFIDDG
jgi:hypothetical protein